MMNRHRVVVRGIGPSKVVVFQVPPPNATGHGETVAADNVSFEAESKAKFVALIHYIGLGTANWLLQEEAKAILERLRF